MFKLLIAFFLLALLFTVVVATTPTAAIPAGVSFPNDDEISLTGADFLAVDEEYSSQNVMLTGTDGDTSTLNLVVPGTELPKTDMEVDLSESTFYSYSSIDYIENRAFINGTYDAGALTEEAAGESNAAATNENQLRSYGSELYAKTTFGDNTTQYQYLDWISYLAFDYNDDGDFDDAQDNHYQPFIDDRSVIYVCIKADWSNTSDTEGYVMLTLSFETTVSNDYDVELILKPGTGTSDWSNDDASGENKITLTLYNADTDWNAFQFDIGELLENDAGDSPSLIGLDTIELRHFGDGGSGNTLESWIRNICVWEELMAFTDNTDDDNDWDVDGQAGPDNPGLWDDNDYIASSVTDAGASDATVPLENKITNGYILLVPAMIINFEGVAAIDLAENAAGSIDGESMTPSVSSVSNGDGTYTTTVEFDFDTRHLADTNGGFKDASTYWAYSDMDHNMTLDEDVLGVDYSDFQDQLVSYEYEYVSYVSTVESAWDGATKDDDSVQYDFANPDSDDGGFCHFKYSFITDNDYSGEVTPTTSATGVQTTTSSSEPEAGGQLIQGIDNSVLYIGLAGASIGGGILLLRRNR